MKAATATGAGSVVGERVFTRRDWLAFAGLTAINLAASAYALVYWLSRADWPQDLVAFVLLTLPLCLALVVFESKWLALPLMRRPPNLPVTPGLKVGVATTFVPSLESREMLEETLQALVAMEYPHDTWVLDEEDDDGVRELCKRLGAHHFSRKAMSRYRGEGGRFATGSKHGNYNAWLAEVGFERYDVITAFDPDHVPEPGFLLAVLGHFTDPEVGYVQAAQVYYNQSASFIARGAAEETYHYYSSTQMSAYAVGYPIVVGCHNTHRAAALQEVGGFAPHDADDLLITIFYRAAKWRGVYLPQRLAAGLAPVDWPGYLAQQRRWARAIMDVKFRVLPKTGARLAPVERMTSLLQGLYFLHPLVIALIVGLLVWMLASGSTPEVLSWATAVPLAALLAVLALCDRYRQRFYLDPRNERGFHWRAWLLRFAKWPYVLLALIDVALGSTRPYTVTEKVRAERSRYPVARAHLPIVGLVALAWGIGMVRGAITNPVLHVAAGALLALSIAVALTELISFPDPYDPNLRKRLRAQMALERS